MIDTAWLVFFRSLHEGSEGIICLMPPSRRPIHLLLHHLLSTRVVCSFGRGSITIHPTRAHTSSVLIQINQIRPLCVLHGIWYWLGSRFEIRILRYDILFGGKMF